jgi:hypothetical protein
MPEGQLTIVWHGDGKWLYLFLILFPFFEIFLSNFFSARMKN